MIGRIFQLLIVFMILVMACNAKENKESVKIGLSFQKSKVVNTSLSSSFLYPILEIENLSRDSIFVYFDNDPLVIIDSTNSIIELRYSIEKLPDDITYYEFPYPTFIGIGPESKFQYYHEVEFFGYFKKLHSGNWNVFTTIGYLHHFNDSKWVRNHQMRDRIVNNQKVIKSKMSLLLVEKK